jgi:hypothetical protein
MWRAARRDARKLRLILNQRASAAGTADADAEALMRR